MRHRKRLKKLGVYSGYRRSLLRNIVGSLIESERITTTLPKAKAAKRVAEKLITAAKIDDLNSRRKIHSFIFKDEVVSKLFAITKEHFLERNGGYTRIIKAGQRRGDGAPLAILELIKKK